MSKRAVVAVGADWAYYSPASLHLRKTITLTGAAGLGAIGNITVGTVTGAVLIDKIIPICVTGLGIVAPLTITNISVANPTEITTSVAHGLTSGDSVTIAGSDSTPTVDGARTVTVTGANTFTVPVNVTILGTTGTVDVGTSTLSLGVVVDPDKFIAATTATDIDTDEFWTSNTPTADVVSIPAALQGVITDNDLIAEVISTTTGQKISSGVIRFEIFWTPLSSDAAIV